MSSDAALREARIDFLADAPSAAHLAIREQLAALAAFVGDEKALAHLDVTPLPAEQLDLSEVPSEIHARIRHIDDLIDMALKGSPEDDMVELRIIARRILLHVAWRSPNLYRRRSRDDLLAAGVAIIAAYGNGRGPLGGRLRALIHTRLPATDTAYQRGVSVLAAAGVALVRVPVDLPEGLEYTWSDYTHVIANPNLQTSATRQLIERTRLLLEERTAAPKSVDAFAPSPVGTL